MKLSVNKILPLFFSALCAVLISCGAGVNSDPVSPDAGGPMSDSETLQYRGCAQDLDCIYVQNGCCDCANGGEDIAVEVTKLTEFMEKFDCTNVACTMIAATPACGTGTVACKTGLCEYTAAVETPFPAVP
jgi:hypothetical protein